MNKPSTFLYLVYCGCILLVFSVAYASSKSPQTEPSTDNPTNTTINTSTSNIGKGFSLSYTTNIYSMLQDSKGNYWFGSGHEGVCRFDGTTATYFTVVDGLSDNQIRSIQEDKQGVIWFGTSNGISSYDNGAITSYGSSTAISPLFPMLEAPWSLAPDELWFNAGNRAGIYRRRGLQFSYLALPSLGDSVDHFCAVTGFSAGADGKRWIATYGAAFGYNGQHFDIIDDSALSPTAVFDPLDFSQRPKDVSRLHIRSILEDSQGRLWIGNNGLGVLLKQDDTVVNFSAQRGLIHANSTGGGASSPAGTLEHVFAITEDQHGNIWFGDRDTGAWKFDGQTMTNYTAKDGLVGSFVRSIYEDPAGNLWIGMGSGHVYLFNKGVFERKWK